MTKGSLDEQTFLVLLDVIPEMLDERCLSSSRRVQHDIHEMLAASVRQLPDVAKGGELVRSPHENAFHGGYQVREQCMSA